MAVERYLKRSKIVAAAVAVGAATLPAAMTPVAAQDAAAFYSGKTVSLQVGYSVGGGYDLYARAIAPYLARHIPGKPAVVVKNMPGAGSLKLAIYMQTVAVRDGTEIATVARGVPVENLLGATKTVFDAAQANWLGSMNSEASICMTMARSGVATLDDMRRKELSYGTQGKGSDSEVMGHFVKNLFGAKMKIITGYPGTSESILAMERGEVDGNCGWSWTSVKQSRPAWIAEKAMNIVMQMALTKHPELQAYPLITEFAKTPAERAQVELVMSRQTMGRPFFAPQGVPAERVAALRTAFMAALNDPEFKAYADRTKLEINPVSGEEVQALLERLLKTPADVVAATRRNISAD